MRRKKFDANMQLFPQPSENSDASMWVQSLRAPGCEVQKAGLGEKLILKSRTTWITAIDVSKDDDSLFVLYRQISGGASTDLVGRYRPNGTLIHDVKIAPHADSIAVGPLDEPNAEVRFAMSGIPVFAAFPPGILPICVSYVGSTGIYTHYSKNFVEELQFLRAYRQIVRVYHLDGSPARQPVPIPEYYRKFNLEHMTVDECCNIYLRYSMQCYLITPNGVVSDSPRTNKIGSFLFKKANLGPIIRGGGITGAIFTGGFVFCRDDSPWFLLECDIERMFDCPKAEHGRHRRYTVFGVSINATGDVLYFLVSADGEYHRQVYRGTVQGMINTACDVGFMHAFNGWVSIED